MTTFGNKKEYKFFKVLMLIRMDFGDYVDNCLKQKLSISETGMWKRPICSGDHYVSHQGTNMISIFDMSGTGGLISIILFSALNDLM